MEDEIKSDDLIRHIGVRSLKPTSCEGCWSESTNYSIEDLEDTHVARARIEAMFYVLRRGNWKNKSNFRARARSDHERVDEERPRAKRQEQRKTNFRHPPNVFVLSSTRMRCTQK